MPLKNDRSTNIDGDQIKNGAIGFSELKSKQTTVDSDEPNEGDILIKENATLSGQDYEFNWKNPCDVFPIDGRIFK